MIALTTAQIIAIVIFVVVMALIISEKVHRTTAALAGAVALILSGVLTFDNGVEHIDFGTLGVLVGMMIFVAVVKNSGIFEYLAIRAAKLAKGSKDALSEKTEWVLHSISCRAAIKAGDKTSPQELMALAEKILSGEVPPFCPHGRPCVLKLTRKELEKQFGRIV